METSEIHSLNLLKAVMQEVIDRKAQFRMSCFIHSNTTKYWKDSTLEEHITCGTIACARGWFLLKYPVSYDDHPLFGDSDVYNWLFNSIWELIAPRPEDVLIRIDWLIQNGLDQLKQKAALGTGWQVQLWQQECITAV